MTPIRWSPEAAADLEGIVDQIEIDSIARASNVAREIFDHVERLTQYPHLGRPGRRDGTRELVIPGLPYLAIYRLRNGVIEVGRILHGAQNWS
ncbi:MAG: type II toxin-antitoxin system RelE/ParE family toxin [Bryobacterales bacterium]|nr:type II toxin-antitoxin system RelE/ParE family toxin [Bryobacterales bacterium]